MRTNRSNWVVSLVVSGLGLAMALPLAAQRPTREVGHANAGNSRVESTSSASGVRSRPMENMGGRRLEPSGAPQPFARLGGGFLRVRGFESTIPFYRTPRQFVCPDAHFWRNRDIMAEIQALARGGPIAVSLVAEDANEVQGIADFPSGFKGYSFVVPPGGNLHVRLNHVKEGWFRVAMVNRWGQVGAGMLHNLIPTGNPEVRYTNPSKTAQAVYLVVDDPGWMSSTAYPFTLTVKRDWEPGKVIPNSVKPVEGIWAMNATPGFSAEFGAPHVRASFGVGSRW